MWAQAEVQLKSQPKVGSHIAVPRQAELGLCASDPSQLDKCFKGSVKGVHYTIAFRRHRLRGNVVTYVYTKDPNFESPDGLRVGRVLDAETILAAPGFEVYGRKGEGWIPVVGFNNEVYLARDGMADEKVSAKSLFPSKGKPVRLRIIGFAMR